MLYDAVKAMVLKRCIDMGIHLGEDFINLVTILCKHAKEGEQKYVWSGIIKLYLLRPKMDGINLLRGLRPLILRLDNDEAYIGKVYKDYDAIAGNNLSVLIKNENLEGIKAHDLFKEILENSFICDHDFEIILVQKDTSQRHAYIVAPTPLQAMKIELYWIPVPNLELLLGRTSLKISIEDKVKKECLILNLYRLSKLMKVDATSKGIKQKMGEKNVVLIWYHKQDKTWRHGSSANVQCLNPIVYRQFVNKTLFIGGHYVKFKPH